MTAQSKQFLEILPWHKYGNSQRNKKFQPTSNPIAVPVTYAQDGTSTRPNALGMRPMQERAYQKRGEQYLLIKSPPASGKSRALMFIALDKLENQALKQAIIVIPEKLIGSSFHNEPTTHCKVGGKVRCEMIPELKQCLHRIHYQVGSENKFTVRDPNPGGIAVMQVQTSPTSSISTSQA
jgi:hypothetical protein